MVKESGLRLTFAENCDEKISYVKTIENSYDGQLFRGHYKPKKFIWEDEGDIISLIFQKKKLPSICLKTIELSAIDNR